ncbi:hypothetical protein RUM44_002499 [Polyplax serrata]|uniref:Uncharacterized protein n=1 Tax=Polyplax serrata TaxID=468196 RepID=A0ABR1AGG6_POLSC
MCGAMPPLRFNRIRLLRCTAPNIRTPHQRILQVDLQRIDEICGTNREEPLSQRKVWAPLQGSISPLGRSRSATALQCRRSATAALQSQAVGPINRAIHG